MSWVPGLSDFATAVLLLGVIFTVLGAIILFAARRSSSRMGWASLAVGIIVIILAVVLVSPLTTTGGGVPSATGTGASINVVSATAPALPAGCTLYASQYQILCTAVFNKTSDYLAVQAAIGHGTASGATYMQLGFKLIRVDAINATYSFGATVAQLPTFSSLGATPTQYGPIGYKTATSTTNGQWQIYPSAGTLANQYPTVAAPTTSSGVITTGVPIQSFSSATLVWHMTFAGSNSTSFPMTAAQAWANNSYEYSTFTFANAGASATWTVGFDLLGWVA